MFSNLSERLERSFKILKGEGKITEINIAVTLKDVRKALNDADVNYKVAKTFTDTVKQKALGQNVINALKPKELMVKIVHDELVARPPGRRKDHILGQAGQEVQVYARQAPPAGRRRRLPPRRPRAAPRPGRKHRRAPVHRGGEQGPRGHLAQRHPLRPREQL